MRRVWWMWWIPRARGPRRSAPTLSLRPTPRRSPLASRRAGCLCVAGADAGTAFSDYIATVTTSCPRTGPPASRQTTRRSTSCATSVRCGSTTRAELARSAVPLATRERFELHARSRRRAFGTMARDGTRRHASIAARRRPDSRPPRCVDGEGAGERDTASASSTTCSTCWRATDASTSTVRARGTCRPERTTPWRTSGSPRPGPGRGARRPRRVAPSATPRSRWTRPARPAHRHLRPRPCTSVPDLPPGATATSTTSSSRSSSGRWP